MNEFHKVYLTNTQTKKKEEFIPLHSKKILLYACGITPYDYSHVGHGRSYVFTDLLVRLFTFLGYEVVYVRNVTDIDDKLLIKAEKAGDFMAYKDIAQKYTILYQEEMKKLGCLEPTFEPCVTENMDEIIRFISELIVLEKAYVVDNDVYFDVSSYPEYGKLSGRNLDDMQAGARVEINTAKRNPADFVLWKGNDKGLFWKAPWGYGRPGWHIECSALAKKYLGKTIDIHCGGADLIFPHHENERAQTESLFDKTFVHYWVHNGLLQIDKEKMSKSLGNILSLKEVFEKIDPMVLRFYFLQHHYRSPMDFSFKNLEAAKTAYKKIISLFERVSDSYEQDFKEYDVVNKIVDALCDDCNTPKALGILFEHIDLIRQDLQLAGAVKKILKNVFGLTLASIDEKIVETTPQIRALIDEREQARKAKNWDVADKIRDKLKDLGYEVQDKKM